MKQLVIELIEEEMENIYGGEVQWILVNGELIVVNV